MVIDTSAVVAILMRESDARLYTDAMEASNACRISVANYFEASIVVDQRGDAIARRSFDSFFEDAGIEIEPMSLKQAKLARQAYADFGKGRHKAGLNFGDCIAYALAKSLRQPLLYKGNDFRHTDISAAL